MKIGVISDTHLARPSPDLYHVVETVFQDVSVVLHAGDLTETSVLDVFSGKTVHAVCGNMDRKEARTQLSEKIVIELAGYRIGLIHGSGSPRGIENRILPFFKNVHAIVYGHTHRSSSCIRKGVLLFNPGAFSGSFLFGRNRSVGILSINNDGITGTHVEI